MTSPTPPDVPTVDPDPGHTAGTPPTGWLANLKIAAFVLLIFGPIGIPVALLITSGLNWAGGFLAVATASVLWALSLSWVVASMVASMSTPTAEQRARQSAGTRWGMRLLGVVFGGGVWLVTLSTSCLSVATLTVPSRHDDIAADFGDAAAPLIAAGQTIGWVAVVIAVLGPVAGWAAGRLIRARRHH